MPSVGWALKGDTWSAFWGGRNGPGAMTAKVTVGCLRALGSGVVSSSEKLGLGLLSERSESLLELLTSEDRGDDRGDGQGLHDTEPSSEEWRGGDDPGRTNQNPLGELERPEESLEASSDATDPDRPLRRWAGCRSWSTLTSRMIEAAHSSHVPLSRASPSPASELESEADDWARRAGDSRPCFSRARVRPDGPSLPLGPMPAAAS